MNTTQEDPTRNTLLYLTVTAACESVLPRVREECLRMARQHGLNVVKEYVDIGTPAGRQLPAELDRLLNDLAQLPTGCFVMTYEYFQLSRSVRQLREIDRRIAASGAQLVTIAGLVPGNVLPVRMLPRARGLAHS